MPGYDLHTHTVLSDGTTTPEQNVADAVALGLEGLGVTDHDTTAPFERARTAAAGTGLDLVLGTEFSAELEGRSVHVLGYWVDPGNQPLQDEMDRLRNEREHRARAIVGKLHDLGVEVVLDRVHELAGAAPVGRPHIAQAVVEAGAAASTDEVFGTWLADDGPAYVPKHAVHPVEAVRLLIAAGGVAVLAHPGLYGGDRPDAEVPGLSAETVEALAAAGLVGIEADHPDHTEAQRTRYRDLARGLGLEVTAGSDYHGERKPNQLGTPTVGRDVVERLAARRDGAG